MNEPTPGNNNSLETKNSINSVRNQLKEYLEKGSKSETLKLGNEEAASIHEKIVNRIATETDLSNELDGILTIGHLFEPTPSLKQVDCTANGRSDIVPINASSPAGEYITNAIRKMFHLPSARAAYNPRSRTINVSADSTARGTMDSILALASGKFDEIVGFELAHEIGHAFQSEKVEISTPDLITQASQMEGSLVENLHTIIRPPDLTILTEVQSYMIGWSAGYSAPEANVAREAVTKAGINLDDVKLEVNGVDISNYDECGIGDTKTEVIRNVREYLPDKNKQDTIRISSAFDQITILRELGLKHDEIARLIRLNSENIKSGREWDNANQNFKFLELKIAEITSGNATGIDREQLLEQSERKRHERGRKIISIALEELYSGLRSSAKY